MSWFVGSLAYVSEHGRGFGFYSTPKGWQDRYVEQSYHAYDPVFRYAMTNQPSTTWSNCRSRACAKGAGKKARAIFGESAEFGLTEGFIIPVNGSGVPPACVTLGGTDLDLSETMQMSLFVVGAFAFQGLRRLVDDARPVQPYLTPQEICVLCLSAEGIPAAQIASIMKLSHAAVRMLRGRIKEKYGVVTMIHACALAVMDGSLRGSVIH